MKYAAKFSKKTKEAIFNRDGGKCIICSGEPHSIHHVYYGSESIYTPDRNDLNMGVALCFTHHNMAHGCSKGEGIRQDCIYYLKNIYDSTIGITGTDQTS